MDTTNRVVWIQQVEEYFKEDGALSIYLYLVEVLGMHLEDMDVI